MKLRNPYLEMIAECEASKGLNAWEKEFMISIGRKLDRNGALSTNQKDKLKVIHTRVSKEN